MQVGLATQTAAGLWPITRLPSLPVPYTALQLVFGLLVGFCNVAGGAVAYISGRSCCWDCGDAQASSNTLAGLLGGRCILHASRAMLPAACLLHPFCSLGADGITAWQGINPSLIFAVFLPTLVMASALELNWHMLVRPE